MERRDNAESLPPVMPVDGSGSGMGGSAATLEDEEAVRRMPTLRDDLRNPVPHQELAASAVHFREASAMPVEEGNAADDLASQPPRLSRTSELVKRAEDLSLAVVALLVTLPALLAIAVAIKLDTPGPILFVQRRYGRDGRIIRVFKFRSMRVDDNDELCVRQTALDDPRVTAVGRFLRKHSLDELPQIFNVLRGDMSLVGPRPHAIGTSIAGRPLSQLARTYNYRHLVKPGITGWAQVNGWRGEMSSVHELTKRVEHDIYYISNWSFRLDLKILLRTVASVLHDDSAY